MNDIKIVSQDDPYKILGIEENTNLEQIKSAYLKMKDIYSKNNPAVYPLMDDQSLFSTAEVIDDAYKKILEQKQIQKLETITENKKIGLKIRCLGYNNAESILKKLIEKDFDISSGKTYKKLRDKLKVDVSDIIYQTKISKSIIIAIENDDYKNLPQEVYTRGFLRSYLNYLGIKNKKKIVDEYCNKAYRKSNLIH